MAVHDLVGALAAVAAHAPDRPALVHRDEVVGYRDLLRRAELAAAGVDRLAPGGGTLGLRARKSPDSIAAVLACLGRGRPVLLPSVELGAVVLDRLFGVAGCVAAPTTELVVAAGSDTAGLPLDVPADPDAVALLLTTSGSTGVPKVVPLGHGAIDRFTGWAGVHFGLGPDSVVLNHSPLNFDLCLLDIWATLRHGGTVVLVDPARGTDGRYLARQIDDHEVTLVQGVPMLFRQLLDAGGSHPSVRDVLLTGESTPPRLLRELPALFPNARFHDVYGCTETNDSLVRLLDERDLADGVAGLGEPLPGVSVLVVDGGTVRTGEGVGELYVATPFQTAGYLDTSLNEAKFTGHPEGADDRRYFRSGDLVERTADGRLVLLGRTDLQVKVRGVRTNLGDVEHVLAEHTDVAEAVVVAVPDPVAGHVLHAEVRRVPGALLDGLAARRHCADRLPRTAVPSTFRISDDPIPRTSTGKPDRRRLLTTRTAKD